MKYIVILTTFAFLSIHAAAQMSFTKPTATFLMHSSGLHVKKAADGVAKLESRSVMTPQKMIIVPVGGGYYVLRTTTEPSYMALSGE